MLAVDLDLCLQRMVHVCGFEIVLTIQNGECYWVVWGNRV